VLAAGIAGAVVGDSIGYFVGQRDGGSLLRRLPRRLLNPRHLGRTNEAIRRWAAGRHRRSRRGQPTP